jgi:hypothetical protein
LDNHLRDKEQELSNCYRCSFEHDEELLRHCVLLRMTEEDIKVKAREFEEFQTTKDLEIPNLQEELEEV